MPFSAEQVFTWHERVGAMQRLLPPWQPVRAVHQADSLAHGASVIGLPIGLRWRAEHQVADYERFRLFTDELAPVGSRQLPLRPLRWRHKHEVVPESANTCLMRDEVETNLPARMVRRMLTYRHGQLAQDLTAHQRAARHGMEPMVIAVTGSHGLVGTALVAFLQSGGHKVYRLVRGTARADNERFWNPEDPDVASLAGCDAVIHLAGATIAGRFTQKHRERIRDSRIEPTRKLARAAAAAGVKTFVSASAIGVYGAHAGEKLLDEDAEHGTDFLAQTVQDWEAAAREGQAQGMRRVQVRTGLVQSPQSGVLGLLRPLYLSGLGGRIGQGQQWQSWIGLDDLVEIYHRALWDVFLEGPVNAVAPCPVRNQEYSKTLARALHRLDLLPVPTLAPKRLLGAQGADLLALASQRVTPAKLLQRSHTFRTPHLDEALAHCLGVQPEDKAL